MGKEWDPEDLIDAVDSAKPPKNKKDEDAIEGLMRAICTKVRNGAPIPAAYKKDYGETWDHVAIQLWRNT
jgi:hypothetical protein